MHCPRDSHVLVERKSDDKSAWCCNVCGGGFALLGLKAAPPKTAPKSRAEWDPEILCPRDKAKMHTFPHRHLVLDVCPKCFGVWLDGDEIGKILGRAYSPNEAPKQGKVDLAAAEHEMFRFFLFWLAAELFSFIPGL